MDPKAMEKLSYGVFLVSTKSGETINGCITNTCIQVASQTADGPAMVAISCINGNYTPELIKKSGVFAVTVLSEKVSFETIKHFGMQSGRNTDKFANLSYETDMNGVPYIKWAANAVISCKVMGSFDLGSHTMFIAEIQDAQVLDSSTPSLTYAKYHTDVKPKPQAPAPAKKIKGWRCRICGYVYEGEKLPEDFTCPLCGHPADDFEPIYE